jgi:uncharacterized membrane protein YfcA
MGLFGRVRSLATGALSGFFGVGGGFLIVPALMLATGMSIMNAVSSSLVAVTAFGRTALPAMLVRTCARPSGPVLWTGRRNKYDQIV